MGAGRFAALIGQEGLVLMLLGMVAAVVFGAWHALLPGHGKTLMAAAMVGSGAPARQAIVAGVSVAAMHTVSVIALGLVVFGLEHAFRPEAVYPWLRLTSGVAALGLGLVLARGRLRSWRAGRSRSGHEPRAIRSTRTTCPPRVCSRARGSPRWRSRAGSCRRRARWS